jgi:DNA-binding response OmpR family regulator
MYYSTALLAGSYNCQSNAIMIAENDSRIVTRQTTLQARRYKIMIVDDEQDITTIFKIGLENNQFIVTTFNDPIEALSNFKPGLYDLLILDVRMPGMNGFQLYQEIRKIDSRVKVCFLTAFEGSRSEFRKSFPSLEEVKCYLKKPITVQELIKRLIELAKS